MKRQSESDRSHIDRLLADLTNIAGGQCGGLLAFAIGGAVGLALFAGLFGLKVVDPRYIDWVLTSVEPDPATNFLGWEFFRSEPWSFPFGSLRSYGMESASSIVFTDSIPGVALLLKSVQMFLPEPCQYLGAWALTSFMLQGGVAGLLASRLCKPRLTVAFIAGLFVLSPPLLNRVEMHFALTSHWMILAALASYLGNRAIGRFMLWAMLLVCAVLVHFYLFFMVACIWAADVIKQSVVMRRLSLRQVIVVCSLTMASVVVVMWCAGYFTVETAQGDIGSYGWLRMHALSPLDSNGVWSRVLPDIPSGPGTADGFNFLGLGMIALAAIAFAKTKGIVVSNESWQFVSPLIAVGILLYMMSLSIRPSIGTLTFDVSLKGLISALGAIAVLVVGLGYRWKSAESAFAGLGSIVKGDVGKAWAYLLIAAFLGSVIVAPILAAAVTRLPFVADFFVAFRAVGRMSWPIYYGFMLWVFWVLGKTIDARNFTAAVGLAFALQLYDIAGGPAYIRENTMRNDANFAASDLNVLKNPFWHQAAHGKRVLYLLHPAANRPPGYEAFAMLALQAHMSINKAYYGRPRFLAHNRAYAALWSALEHGHLEKDALYVVYPEEWSRLDVVAAGVEGFPEIRKVDGFKVFAYPQMEPPKP